MIERAMQPVQLHERIQLIDILRGFALLGILLVNMHLFSHPVYAILLAPVTAPPLLDRIAEWFIRFAAEGKFYSLFSLLFGLGLTIQMSRAQARGSRFVPTYVRRLFFLLLIGMVHAFLIWTGDILILYALLGVLLILFRNARHLRRDHAPPDPGIPGLCRFRRAGHGAGHPGHVPDRRLLRPAASL
jgi:uncharacterized protein